MPRKSYNPKRMLVVEKPESAELNALAEKIRYNGNPEHKRSPGDFALTPPSAPRADKTLCEPAGIRTKLEALAALQAGVRKGLISDQMRGSFPQNIWSIAGGVPFEAQLDNESAGTYHGYPMPEADPFRVMVLRAWRADEQP